MKLAFRIDNAAFADDKNFEVARILDRAGKDFADYAEDFSLSDLNGNRVGAASLTGDVPTPPGRAIVVEMATDNAAFADTYAGEEVGRILREAAQKVRDGAFDGEMYLRDINGNKVGKLVENELPQLEEKVTYTRRSSNDSSLEP